MSNKEENVVEQPIVTDPLAYDFPENTMITIPANIWMRNTHFTGAVAHNETKEMISMNEFSPDKGPEIDENGQVVPQEEKVIIYTTPIGKEAADLFSLNIQWQLELIKNGVAIKKTELQKRAQGPELDLG